jgi:light-regulated signal transduction histidine kinase (bacteriophytochrome)
MICLQPVEKYCRNNLISLNWTILYPALRMNNQAKYYKISRTDNGLGFEQQYAESIFLLFHRLQNKTEYPGSGIGLSICKKIVENHNGFIIAEGKPGIGSVFKFFPSGIKNLTLHSFIYIQIMQQIPVAV